MAYNRIAKQSGFTIVELLIVIVIIGVLSSVAVAAFSGASDRATASRAAQHANSYAKAFELYYNTYGKYPDISPLQDGSLTNYCLGSPSDFPVTSDFEAGQCGMSSDDDTTKVYASAAFNTEIQKVMAPASNLALPAVPHPWGLSFKHRGIQVQTAQFAGKWWSSFRWELRGRQSCAAGGSNTQTYYSDENNVTRCLALLHSHL